MSFFTSYPKIGRHCVIKIMTPIAVIKPETTGYGIYLIYFPKPKTPKVI